MSSPGLDTDQEPCRPPGLVPWLLAEDKEVRWGFKVADLAEAQLGRHDPELVLETPPAGHQLHRAGPKDGANPGVAWIWTFPQLRQVRQTGRC